MRVASRSRRDQDALVRVTTNYTGSLDDERKFVGYYLDFVAARTGARLFSTSDPFAYYFVETEDGYVVAYKDGGVAWRDDFSDRLSRRSSATRR